MEAKQPLIVAIDTASDTAGVALCEGPTLLGEATWYARQSHSREVLPTLEWLLARHKRDKSQIEALAVDLGPGSYAGLRVGVSTAKALAYGFGAKLVGVERLPAEAWPLAPAATGRVVPVQIAGRAELAWGVYYAEGETLVEAVASRLGSLQALVETLQPGDVLCGEADRLDEASREAVSQAGARIVSVTNARVIAIAQLGWQRLERGESDDVDALEPLYLRAPAIGPQPPRP